MANELKKAVNLTPFNVDDAVPQEPYYDALYADDIIFGGLGNDFLHGGSGNDLISGAEALPVAYFEKFAPYTTPDSTRTGTATRSDYALPYNPGNTLGFEARKAGEFAAYDEYNPLRKIVLNDSSVGVIDGEYFANFLIEGPLSVYGDGRSTDGDDNIFGDLGNDWIVGGSGKDHLYGGYGNDLINADDNHDTMAGTVDRLANNTPDTAYSYEDIAYGGAGRDVLIGNTGGDRLIDWVGEFDSFVVPFAPFGAFAISRQLSPALMDYLYALSAADGADPTRDVDEGRLASDPRNGEPFGELGLVMQKDFDWQDQTGAPDDPQPGNIPGGTRDVLRGADFNNVSAATDQYGSLIGFAADSGSWTVKNNRLEVSPTALGGDAASVFYVDSYLPLYFEIRATINAAKPLGGAKANAYLIFDYISPTDFKFAGVNISTNKIEMGHRTAAGWIVDVQTPAQVKPDQDYNLLLAINGLTATLKLDNATLFSHTFAARVDTYGVSHGLNHGMVGLGADNATARVDNLVIQILPPKITLERIEDFDDGAANQFTGFQSGDFTITGDRYVGTPAVAGGTAVDMIDLGQGLATSAYLELSAVVRTNTVAGIAFDGYAANDLKFAALDVQNQKVLIGHVDPRRGWVTDASVSATLVAGADYALSLSLKGTTISVSVNGSLVLSTSFNAAITDGAFGVLTRGGASSFDVFRLRTNDDAYRNAAPWVSVSDAAVNEGASGNPVVTLTLTLSAPALGLTTIDWTTADGTGTAGEDYAAASGTVTFAPGSLTATITVTVIGDTAIEPDEIFKLLLSNPVGLTVADNAAVVTVANDDAVVAAPTLSVADVSIVEGNTGTKSLVITVTLSAASPTSVTVSFATLAGSATAGTDYESTSGTLTFAPGVTTQTISVTIVGDRAKESNESFQIVLSNASVGVTRSTAIVTIVDDERALTASGTPSVAQDETSLTLQAAEPVLAAAIDLWQQAGADAAALAQVVFVVTDLPGELLALTVDSTIYLDTDAAGFGWFVDATGGVTDGRMDLLTVVMHEIGHILGFDHDDSAAASLMDETLDAGARYVMHDDGPSMVSNAASAAILEFADVLPIGVGSTAADARSEVGRPAAAFTSTMTSVGLVEITVLTPARPHALEADTRAGKNYAVPVSSDAAAASFANLQESDSTRSRSRSAEGADAGDGESEILIWTEAVDDGDLADALLLELEFALKSKPRAADAGPAAPISNGQGRDRARS